MEYCIKIKLFFVLIVFLLRKSGGMATPAAVISNPNVEFRPWPRSCMERNMVQSGCEKCTDCTLFSKVTDSPERGLNIYRHALIEDQASQQPVDASEYVFILQNTKPTAQTTKDTLCDLENNKTCCQRCQDIQDQVGELLKLIPIIREKITISVCGHCINQTYHHCKRCHEALKKFIKYYNPLPETNDDIKHLGIKTSYKNVDQYAQAGLDTAIISDTDTQKPKDKFNTHSEAILKEKPTNRPMDMDMDITYKLRLCRSYDDVNTIDIPYSEYKPIKSILKHKDDEETPQKRKTPCNQPFPEEDRSCTMEFDLEYQNFVKSGKKYSFYFAKKKRPKKGQPKSLVSSSMLIAMTQETIKLKQIEDQARKKKLEEAKKEKERLEVERKQMKKMIAEKEKEEQEAKQKEEEEAKLKEEEAKKYEKETQKKEKITKKKEPSASLSKITDDVGKTTKSKPKAEIGFDGETGKSKKTKETPIFEKRTPKEASQKAFDRQKPQKPSPDTKKPVGIDKQTDAYKKDKETSTLKGDLEKPAGKDKQKTADEGTQKPTEGKIDKDTQNMMDEIKTSKDKPKKTSKDYTDITKMKKSKDDDKKKKKEKPVSEDNQTTKDETKTKEEKKTEKQTTKKEPKQPTLPKEIQKKPGSEDLILKMIQGDKGDRPRREPPPAKTKPAPATEIKPPKPKPIPIVKPPSHSASLEIAAAEKLYLERTLSKEECVYQKDIVDYLPALPEYGDEIEVFTSTEPTFLVKKQTGIEIKPPRKGLKDLSKIIDKNKQKKEHRIKTPNQEKEHIKDKPIIEGIPPVDNEVETGIPPGVIRYALSNRTYIDKGWTLLPTDKVVRKVNIYPMKPVNPESNWFHKNQGKGMVSYDTGENFARVNQNGTRGHWFYKNGKLALAYSKYTDSNADGDENPASRIIVYSRGDKDSFGNEEPVAVLATFDHNGNGIVFDQAGKVRLRYNQTEGVLLDKTLGPPSHWAWHSLNEPPVLQHVWVDTALTEKDPIIASIPAPDDKVPKPPDEHMCAIEYENFLKEKQSNKCRIFTPYKIKSKALKINENFALRVLDQRTIYLVFNEGNVNLKLNIGLELDHNEIIDVKTSELEDVLNPFDTLPASSNSISQLQAMLTEVQSKDRARNARDRWLKPTITSSVDKFDSFLSRPLRPSPGCVPRSRSMSPECSPVACILRHPKTAC